MSGATDLLKVIRDISPNPSELFAMGKVTVVTAGSKTVSLEMTPSATAIPNVRYMKSIGTPVVNDNALVLKLDSRWLVIGLF